MNAYVSKVLKGIGTVILLTGVLAPGAPAWAQDKTVTTTKAQALVDQLYGAITAPHDQIATIVDRVTTPDWQDCSDTTTCEGRDPSVQHWIGFLDLIPNLRWEQRDMMVSGDKIIVRGEESGTPVGPFLGLQPSGKSFKVMTIDVHQVRDGKIAATYHLENWGAALRQLAPGRS